MKKYISLSLLMAAISISSCKDGVVEPGNKDTTADAALPMPILYQGEAAIGSNGNVVTVMNWNKYLGNGKMDSAFALLADSVTIRLSGGEVFNTTADSAKAIVRSYFDAIKTVNIQYVTIVPIDVKVSDTQTDQWVLSWTDEDYTMKNDTKEHSIIHEDYRLVNGKIREVNQYARKVVAPTVPAKTK